MAVGIAYAAIWVIGALLTDNSAGFVVAALWAIGLYLFFLGDVLGDVATFMTLCLK